MGKTVCAVVTDDMFEQLEKLRKEQGVNISFLIRNLLREFLGK